MKKTEKKNNDEKPKGKEVIKEKTVPCTVEVPQELHYKIRVWCLNSNRKLKDALPEFVKLGFETFTTKSKGK